MTAGINAPGRARISVRSLRTDRWWLPPLVTNLGLATFVIYATVRSFMGEWYWVNDYHYLTPFYSPCISESCVPGSAHFGEWIGELPGWIPMGFLALPFLLGFRLTCYYYRKAYYRSVWQSPTACAVAEPHAKYSGETKFPLILQNLHRYFFYVAGLVALINTYDAIVAFHSPDGGFGFGLGNVVLVVNVVMLWAYTLSCHSCRHIAGGRLKHFSAHPVRYKLWTFISKLNVRHMQLAWVTLGTLMLTDLYVMLVASGAISDLRFVEKEEFFMTQVERHTYDVVVIGAGGAGLRAAIEARQRGLRTAVVCKSLFGKAHTVMAEGGVAASMGNVNSNDNWQVHFRDTMRGGKFLNNWRMAELHAKEAPDRVWELETYGALFDRTADGRISQRNFGGHEYPRLAHVGDRTGLELIRTLQQKIVSLQQEDFKESGDYEAKIKVFAECTITELLKDGDKISGAFGYWRESGRFIAFDAPAVVLATGGIGKSFKVTSNSWEYTGDGHALALRAGATLINMEFIQFHPTGMVWPPSVKGILVTEGVRGDGGVLRNSDGKRFMFDYIPEVFKDKYADNEEEADRWYTDPDGNRRTPDLLPRDEVARAINSEVKAGRGSPHGGVFLDISSRMPAEEIRRRLPSMHHQFKELADVDITAEPMEVGPTCHYVMGGVEVEPDTAAAKVPGLFAAGEVAGGMHGSNRLGGNSLSDLLVFGRRAGLGAAEYVESLTARPEIAQSDIDGAAERAVQPFDPQGGGVEENPYTLHSELQQSMNDLVGIIRKAGEIRQALDKIAEIKSRIPNIAVEGHRQFNPGWHLAIDLYNMVIVSECVAKAALLREESRGGHTRDDHPAMAANWRNRLLVCSTDGTEVSVVEQPQPPMREELFQLFEIGELEKYYTDEEVAAHPGRKA